MSEEHPLKKIKLSEDKTDLDLAEDLSAGNVSSLETFKLDEILSENNKLKCICLKGRFGTSLDCAVVILEKLRLPTEMEEFLSNADPCLNLRKKSTLANVTDYACYPKVASRDMKATIIYPATPKHVEKYKTQPWYMVVETPEIYQNKVLPYLESQKFSLQWVYNILEHKCEADRIVFEDPDPELGFVLLPDLKWDESEKDSIYLIAICHARNLKSLRDLNSSHLPLLKNIKKKSIDTILQKYSIPSEKLRVFFHYQPSYYHLHIHFTSIHKQVPGSHFEKAHLLDEVIQNIELSDTYYKDVTLSYTLKENDPLYLKMNDSATVSSACK